MNYSFRAWLYGLALGVLAAGSAAAGPTFAHAATQNSAAAAQFVAPAKKKSKGKKSKKKRRSSKAPWMHHTLRRGEALDQVAKRYGVKVGELVRWNQLGKQKRTWPGQQLKTRSRSGLKAPQRRGYTVQRGDGWKKIARRFGVAKATLMAWNHPRKGGLKPGELLVVWRNPEELEAKLEQAEQAKQSEPADKSPEKAPVSDESAEPAASADAEDEAPKLDIDGTSDLPYPDEPNGWLEIPEGGQSVGAPNRGYLVQAVSLPRNPLYYSIRNPDEVWGSSHAIRLLARSLLNFRMASKYRHELVVQGISPRSGGYFYPHRSHQAGRDVDIRLPRSRRAKAGTMPNKIGKVDWPATWQLIEALIATGQVEYIFLDHSRQKQLHKVALKMGVSRATLKRVLQYPRKPGTIRGIVRDAEGHSAHIHVRFRCGREEADCEQR